MSDENITENKVRTERLREVNQPAHWAYLSGVLLGGLLLMLLLIALMGSAAT